MTRLVIALTLLTVWVLACFAVHAAEPQTALKAPWSPKAPTDVVVIACRVDDLTGQPGRQDPAHAAKNWRDLEWHIEGGKLQCKREVNQLQDQAVVMDPTGKLTKPLNSDFSDFAQCASAGMFWSTMWNDAHKGWAVIAIGCPVPIVDPRGIVRGWKMPDCPSKVGTIEGITCEFDENAI